MVDRSLHTDHVTVLYQVSLNGVDSMFAHGMSDSSFWAVATPLSSLSGLLSCCCCCSTHSWEEGWRHGRLGSSYVCTCLPATAVAATAAVKLIAELPNLSNNKWMMVCQDVRSPVFNKKNWAVPIFSNGLPLPCWELISSSGSCQVSTYIQKRNPAYHVPCPLPCCVKV